MTSDIQELQEKISRLKQNEESPNSSSKAKGYSISVMFLTDLLSCILVGLGLGLFFQKFFLTSPLLTAGLTLLGGVAGLYTVIRFAIKQDKK